MAETFIDAERVSASGARLPRSEADRRRVALLCLMAVLAVAMVSLLVGLGRLPIEVWDESRLANNAIEMAGTGLSMVPHYDGAPDRWNTKPPLAIWLMASSVMAFGPQEWALRLPSALAGVATTMLVYGWLAHRRGPVTGLLGALFLLSGSGYVHLHAARSGDYDALLALWTTAMLVAAFEWLRLRPGSAAGRIALAGFAAAAALAFLTKSVQGWIFMPAILGWAAIAGRLGERLRAPSTWAAAAGVVGVVAAYFALREQLDPGYLATTLGNDIVGRYASVIEDHVGGPLTYLADVRPFPWLLPALAVAAWLAWTDRTERREIAGYLGLCCAFYLLVISIARTKLPWYAVPLYPPAAMLAALGVERVASALRSRWADRAARRGRVPTRIGGAAAALLALACVAVVGLNLARQGKREGQLRADPLQAHGFMLRSPAMRELAGGRVWVMHPGFRGPTRDEYYVAPVRYYAKVLGPSGVSVDAGPPGRAPPRDATHALACGHADRARIPADAAIVAENDACVLARIGERG